MPYRKISFENTELQGELFSEDAGVSNTSPLDCYVLCDGTVPFTATIGGVTPSGSLDLSTKAYVDSVAGGGGGGDVFGPASSTDNALVRFDSTTGKQIQNSVVTVDDSGNITTAGTIDGRDVSVDGTKLDTIETNADVTDAANVAAAGAVFANGSVAFTAEQAGVTPTLGTSLATKAYVDSVAGGGSGDVVGPASATDNAVTRFDTTTGKLIQDSAVTIDDSGNIATAGTVDGRDVSVDGAKLDGIEAGADVTDTANVTAAGAVLANGSVAFTGEVAGITPTLTASLATKGYVDSVGGGSGDVVGPASATDNAIARFDTTTGKLVQNSVVTVDDSGNIATAGTVDGRDLSADGTKLDGIESGADVTDTANVTAAGAVMDSELIATSAGAADAGKPIKLDAGGQVDATMINDGDIDHGSIGGLGDDDHTQYSLADGTRAFTNTVSGVTPTASAHLSTKGYVDGHSPSVTRGAVAPGSPSTGSVWVRSTDERWFSYDGTRWLGHDSWWINGNRNTNPVTASENVGFHRNNAATAAQGLYFPFNIRVISFSIWNVDGTVPHVNHEIGIYDGSTFLLSLNFDGVNEYRSTTSAITISAHTRFTFRCAVTSDTPQPAFWWAAARVCEEV